MDQMLIYDIESRFDDLEVKLNNSNRIATFSETASSASQIASGAYLVTFVGQNLVIRNILDDSFITINIDSRDMNNVNSIEFSAGSMIRGITSDINDTSQTLAASIKVVNDLSKRIDDIRLDDILRRLLNCETNITTLFQ